MSSATIFDDMSYEELLEEAVKPHSPEDVLVINRCLRDCIRQLDQEAKEELRKEKDDAGAMREKLREAKSQLVQAKKDMTAAFAKVNKLITAKSCVKHFAAFNTAVDEYTEANASYLNALRRLRDDVKSLKG